MAPPIKYKYLDMDYGVHLPQLVLVCADTGLKLAGGREWLAIAHQTAGNACNQHRVLGTILQPTDAVGEAMVALDRKWLDSCVGMLAAPRLDDMDEYREDLYNLFGHGVDCNYCAHELEEGWYPIDCDPKALKRLTTEKLPKDPDDLVEWRNDTERLLGFLGRWKLYVLGNNCD